MLQTILLFRPDILFSILERSLALNRKWQTVKPTKQNKKTSGKMLFKEAAVQHENQDGCKNAC